MTRINKILYVQMNTFALVVLGIIYVYMRRHTQRYLLEDKLFLTMVYLNALILVLDTAMWFVDGMTGLYLIGINRVVSGIYYALNPVACLAWSCYADYLIYRNTDRLKKVIYPLAIPAALNVVLSICSIFTGWMFSVDANNVYHRGALFPLMAVFSFFYLVYTFVEILLKQDRIQKQYYFPILLFAVPPFVGGIIQTFYYGVSLIWVCMTVSVLIIFINIQTDQLYTDFLTGLYNRRQLDSYLHRIHESQHEAGLGGLLIDIAQFKMVNDVYGHDEGDKALQHVSQLLRATFRNKDFIARMGGDEFVVIMEVKDKPDLEHVIQRLRSNLVRFNQKNIVPYELKLSLGYDCFDGALHRDMEEFVKHIDRLMYSDKQKNDAQARRNG